MINNNEYSFILVNPKNIFHLNLSNIYKNTFQIITFKINQLKTNLIPSSFHFKTTKESIIKFKELSFHKQTSFMDNEDINLMLLFPNDIEEGNYCLIGDLCIDNVGTFDGFTILVDIIDDYKEDGLRAKDRKLFFETNLFNTLFPVKFTKLFPENNIELTFDKGDSQEEKLEKDISKLKIENEILRNENTKLITKENIKKLLSFKIENLNTNLFLRAQKPKRSNIIHIVNKKISPKRTQGNREMQQTYNLNNKNDNIIDEFFNISIKARDKKNNSEIINNMEIHQNCNKKSNYETIKLTNSYLMNEIITDTTRNDVQENSILQTEGNAPTLGSNLTLSNNIVSGKTNIKITKDTPQVILSPEFIIKKIDDDYDDNLNKETIGNINNHEKNKNILITPKNKDELSEEEIERIMNELDKKYYVFSIFDKNEIKNSIIEGKGDQNKIQKILFI